MRQHQVAILAAAVASVFGNTCTCPGMRIDPFTGMCTGGFLGSLANCVCRCNDYAISKGWTSNYYSYSPDGSFSRGDCLCCEHDFSFKEKQKESALRLPSALNDTKDSKDLKPPPPSLPTSGAVKEGNIGAGNVTGTGSSSDGWRNLNICKCAGINCRTVGYNQHTCDNWCDGIAKQYNMSTPVCTFASLDPQGCSVCGWVDPCTMPQ